MKRLIPGLLFIFSINLVMLPLNLSAADPLRLAGFYTDDPPDNNPGVDPDKNSDSSAATDTRTNNGTGTGSVNTPF